MALLPLGLTGFPALPSSPVSAAAAECAGDECQGPPPAPAEIVPGTAIVEGSQNPPVRFPKAHAKKKRHPKKHHHRGKK
jgi:hypothetical protein